LIKYLRFYQIQQNPDDHDIIGSLISLVFTEGGIVAESKSEPPVALRKTQNSWTGVAMIIHRFLFTLGRNKAVLNS